MPGVDYGAVRERISMTRVLELLEFHPCRVRGNQLRGLCPVHGSEDRKSTTFSVNLAKNAFRCFKCGARGNQIDLWAAAKKMSLYQASLDLCDRLAMKVPWVQQW